MNRYTDINEFLDINSMKKLAPNIIVGTYGDRIEKFLSTISIKTIFDYVIVSKDTNVDKPRFTIIHDIETGYTLNDEEITLNNIKNLCLRFAIATLIENTSILKNVTNKIEEFFKDLNIESQLDFNNPYIISTTQHTDYKIDAFNNIIKTVIKIREFSINNSMYVDSIISNNLSLRIEVDKIELDDDIYQSGDNLRILVSDIGIGIVKMLSRVVFFTTCLPFSINGREISIIDVSKHNHMDKITNDQIRFIASIPYETSEFQKKVDDAITACYVSAMLLIKGDSHNVN